ncbi:hypothetical protein F2P81_012021 [Scophthalmus maximus]|uniref:Uncharacterized protein n=1 Tax=Scophthalmus maximus TaxID=52904 RepID=A0A6A4SVL4_SCOMX|nr:hypothetical protein F2P81_012021 [Scophthalmus maximus]
MEIEQTEAEFFFVFGAANTETDPRASVPARAVPTLERVDVKKIPPKNRPRLRKWQRRSTSYDENNGRAHADES